MCVAVWRTRSTRRPCLCLCLMAPSSCGTLICHLPQLMQLSSCQCCNTVPASSTDPTFFFVVRLPSPCCCFSSNSLCQLGLHLLCATALLQPAVLPLDLCHHTCSVRLLILTSSSPSYLSHDTACSVDLYILDCELRASCSYCLLGSQLGTLERIPFPVSQCFSTATPFSL